MKRLASGSNRSQPRLSEGLFEAGVDVVDDFATLMDLGACDYVSLSVVKGPSSLRIQPCDPLDSAVLVDVAP